MRTVGNFKDVFERARTYLAGRDSWWKPIDPVVRFDGSRWMIVSSYENAEDCLMQSSLDDFQSYFYEAMNDQSFTLDDNDSDEFARLYWIGESQSC